VIGAPRAGWILVTRFDFASFSEEDYLSHFFGLLRKAATAISSEAGTAGIGKTRRTRPATTVGRSRRVGLESSSSNVGGLLPNQSLERTRWAPAVRLRRFSIVARRSAPDPLDDTGAESANAMIGAWILLEILGPSALIALSIVLWRKRNRGWAIGLLCVMVLLEANFSFVPYFVGLKNLFPVYRYESSDGGFAADECFKSTACYWSVLQANWNRYKAVHPGAELFRLEPVRPWQFWNWYDYASHPRWRLRYSSSKHSVSSAGGVSSNNSFERTRWAPATRFAGRQSCRAAQLAIR